MHNFGLSDYMMNVLLGLYEELILTMLMYEVNYGACGLLIGLLSLCEVMRLHMYIAQVSLKGDYDLCLMM